MKKMTPEIMKVIKENPNYKVTWRIADPMFPWDDCKTLIIRVNKGEHKFDSHKYISLK